MPVRNNDYQRIDDASIDLITYGIRSLETIGFVLILWRMKCLIVLSKRQMTVSLSDDMQLGLAWPSDVLAILDLYLSFGN